MTEQQLPQPSHRPQSDIPPSTLPKPEPSKTIHVVETCAPAAIEGASSNHQESPDPAVKREDPQAQLQQQTEKEEEKEEPEEKMEVPQEKQSSREERSQPPAPQQETQQDQEQEREEDTQEQRNEEKEKPSINNLWSLIPGSVQRKSSQASSVSEVTLGESLPALGKERSYDLGFATALKSSHLLTIDAASRWFPPDVHPPLSDRARRHRARALARLRARRRALAAAGASSDRKLSTLRRQPSDTSTDAESIDSGGDHIQSGFIMAGTMSCKQDIHGIGTVWDGARSAAGFSQSFSCSSGSEKIDPSMMAKDGSGDADGDQTLTMMSSKVGDLFELMRNVSANAAATALAAEGGSRSDGETECRELGRPVKYKYRQEAARSRKRTRGRFVSEKAPAFVSITELLALRRAERERQQQKDVAPVSVGAG